MKCSRTSVWIDKMSILCEDHSANLLLLEFVHSQAQQGPEGPFLNKKDWQDKNYRKFGKIIPKPECKTDYLNDLQKSLGHLLWFRAWFAKSIESRNFKVWSGQKQYAQALPLLLLGWDAFLATVRGVRFWAGAWWAGTARAAGIRAGVRGLAWLLLNVDLVSNLS